MISQTGHRVIEIPKQSDLVILPCTKTSDYKSEYDVGKAVTYLKLRSEGCKAKNARQYLKARHCKSDITQEKQGPKDYRILKQVVDKQYQNNIIGGWLINVDPSFEMGKKFKQSFKNVLVSDDQDDKIANDLELKKKQLKYDYIKQEKSLKKYIQEISNTLQLRNLSQEDLSKKLKEIIELNADRNQYLDKEGYEHQYLKNLNLFEIKKEFFDKEQALFQSDLGSYPRMYDEDQVRMLKPITVRRNKDDQFLVQTNSEDDDKYGDDIFEKKDDEALLVPNKEEKIRQIQEQFNEGQYILNFEGGKIGSPKRKLKKKIVHKKYYGTKKLTKEQQKQVDELKKKNEVRWDRIREKSMSKSPSSKSMQFNFTQQEINTSVKNSPKNGQSKEKTVKINNNNILNILKADGKQDQQEQKKQPDMQQSQQSGSQGGENKLMGNSSLRQFKKVVKGACFVNTILKKTDEKNEKIILEEEKKKQQEISKENQFQKKLREFKKKHVETIYDTQNMNSLSVDTTNIDKLLSQIETSKETYNVRTLSTNSSKQNLLKKIVGNSSSCSNPSSNFNSRLTASTLRLKNTGKIMEGLPNNNNQKGHMTELMYSSMYSFNSQGKTPNDMKLSYRSNQFLPQSDFVKPNQDYSLYQKDMTSTTRYNGSMSSLQSSNQKHNSKEHIQKKFVINFKPSSHMSGSQSQPTSQEKRQNNTNGMAKTAFQFKIGEDRTSKQQQQSKEEDQSQVNVSQQIYYNVQDQMKSKEYTSNFSNQYLYKKKRSVQFGGSTTKHDQLLKKIGQQQQYKKI